MYWYKDEDAREAQNFFSLNDCKKVQAHKPKKFMLIILDKLYKFACSSDEERDKWITAINKEIKKLKGEVERKVETYYQVKLRKKVIIDHQNLPNPHTDLGEVRRKIEECILKEPYFQKKEAFQKKKDELTPNKEIINKRPSFKEQMPRIKPPESKPVSMNIDQKDVLNTESSNAGLNFNGMTAGFIGDKPKKKRSIFWCCLNCVKFFKSKKKPYNEFEGGV